MSNDFYNVSGAPSTGSQGSSATMRGEFASIAAGFDKMPTLSGNGALPVFVNASATALEATSAATARSRLSVVNDPGSNGIMVRSAAATAIARAFAKSGDGLAVSNADGTAGNPTVALADDVAALEALGSTGFAVRTAANTWAQRSIGVSGPLAITNGDGVAGNVALTTSMATSRILGRTTAGTGVAEELQVGGSLQLASGLLTGFVPEVRQTVSFSEVDSSGYCALLSAGAGLNFNVNAADSDAVLDFASGVDNYRSTLDADATDQGSLAASNTNFIYATYSSATAVTWGNCLIPPQYGYAFDRTQGALLNFENANGSATFLDDFGNTWSAFGGATISTTRFKFGTSSLSSVGGTRGIDCTNITTVGDGSWEIAWWFNANSLPGASARHVLFDATNGATVGINVHLFNNAGTITTRLYLSSDGSTWNVADDQGGARTTWVVNTWYKFRLVFDALAGNYKLYISDAGATESADITVASTARVCAFMKFRIGANAANTAASDGYFDAFRFLRCATNTSTETPSASAPTIADVPVHFFSIPEMKMYEVTAASASAGTNPTMTARTRLFVGEQDTNGSGVTATRNYALRGEYQSADFALTSTSSETTKAHNIGVPPREMSIFALCRSPVSGWRPGDIVKVMTHYSISSVEGFFDGLATDNRNTMSITNLPQGWTAPQRNGGTYIVLASSQWRMFVVAKRGW